MNHPVVRSLVRSRAMILVGAAAIAFGPSGAAFGAPSGKAQGTPTGGGAAAAATPTPDQAGYIIGLNFGAQMHSAGITNEVSVAAIDRGIKAGLAGKKADPADQQRLQSFVREVMTRSLERRETMARTFLAANGRKPGVKTTGSGLEYQVLSEGDAQAPSPKPTDLVTVNYRGRLLDGSEFDSSYKRGQPATFPVDAVIKGWQEALPMIKPGAKWRLFVPPELAYGESPRPGIPPGSLLIFDVDLLSVKPPAAATPPAPPAPPAAAPKATTPNR
ncbi:MAG: FKBP-type peptidyl-prolyl cis-trans isomerase [Gammaproteobacteria bacterium]|nr:FKBP-type peptidyl-prolyl cis-trans isomerase [Gammaproteobacteria bacterium]